MDVMCADIGIPKVGDVCHMTTPISYRRKNQDGTQNYKQLVERFTENWTITGWKFKETSGYGNTSGPHFDATSSSGSASLTTDLVEKNKNLSEIKAKLESNMSLCQMRSYALRTKRVLTQ